MSTGVGVGVPTPRNPQERAPTGGPSGDAILLESGDYLLLESGDYLLKE